ncbi:sel1 repeat family protein, partial [Verrucomicrobia bacterium]|nr:sel1 repeat family protein [Verrucomicrobiota bacterium]
FGKLGTLAESYPEHNEIARMYVLCAIEADPESGLEFLSISPYFREDSARKSLRKIELFEKLGKTAEAKAEEKRALQAFATDPLIKAKALERMIDLYLEDEQEEDELDAVREESESWKKPGAEDDSYLHFVDAYLGVAMEEKSELQPEGGGAKAEYFCSRKLRASPDLFSFESDFDAGMRLAEEEQWEEAIERLRRAAEGGHADAQNELANMYYEGKGVGKDLGKAYEWYREAASQGDATGQKDLGVMYYRGEGVEQDHAEAFRWFHKAAEQGDAEAQSNLAEMYRDGEGGVERDYAKAFKWFSKAAENRDGNLSKSNGKFELARMYENGRGCEKDASKASKLYREIADEGVDGSDCSELHLKAMIAVGNDFKAQGDYDLARKWFEQVSHDAEYPELGYVGLGDLLKEESADHSAAIDWYRKAAEKGNPCGVYELARCMESSSGAERDESSIKKWYEKAAKHDHPGGLFWMSQRASEAGDQEECERLLRKAVAQGDKNTHSTAFNSSGFNDGIEEAGQKLKEMDGYADGKSKGESNQVSKGIVPFNRHAAGYVTVVPFRSQKKKEDPADPSFDTDEIREKIESLIDRNSDVEKATYVSDLTALGTVLKKNKILGLEGRDLLKEMRALVIDMGFYLYGDSHGGGERVLTAAQYKEKRGRHDRKLQVQRRKEKTWDVFFFLLFTAMMVAGLFLLHSFGKYCSELEFIASVLDFLDSKDIRPRLVGMSLLFIASMALGKRLGGFMTRNRYVTKMNFDSHPVIASSPWWLSTICFMAWKFFLSS